jgi:hypothetical protein
VKRLVLLGALLCGAAAQAQGDDLRHPEAARRAAAARRMGEAGDASRIDQLIRLLRDESSLVRAEAARALGSMRAVDASRELMVLAQTDEHAAVRDAAAVAVRQIDVQRFVKSLATADPPPVREEPPPPLSPAPARARGRGVFVVGAVALNALRANDALDGMAAGGLRWGYLEAQLGLGFPALVLVGQARVNLLPHPWLVPYLTLGFAISYNNNTERQPAVSLVAGGGLRLGPWARPDRAPRAIERFFGFVEVLASRVLVQSPPAAARAEERTVSLPVVLGVGAEFWP